MTGGPVTEAFAMDDRGIFPAVGKLGGLGDGSLPTSSRGRVSVWGDAANRLAADIPDGQSAWA